MTGPSPKSYCSHIPGSVTHGWHTRTLPALNATLAWCNRPAGRALRAGEPQRDQLVVRDIGAQPAARALDPLLELGPELIDQLRPRYRPITQTALLSGGDVSLDGVVRAASSPASRTTWLSRTLPESP
jgi:hypothetical protein